MNVRYALALSALLAVPAAWADEPPALQQQLDQESTTQDLKLTDAQKAQIQAIRNEARAKHQAIAQETKGKIDKVLTPEQKAKLEERLKSRAERREDRQEMRQERREERAAAKDAKQDAKIDRKIEKLEAKKAN